MKNLRCNLLGINKHFENSFGGLLKNIKKCGRLYENLKTVSKEFEFYCVK